MSTSTGRYRAQAIIAIIREQGRTVTWLARQIGVSRQYTNDVVHGHIEVKQDMVRRINAALGLPFFLGWTLTESSKTQPKGSEEAA